MVTDPKNNPDAATCFRLESTQSTMLFTRLKNTEPGPGFIHIGDWADDEFIRQITSERAVTRYSKGIPHQEFKKTRERNEALDLPFTTSQHLQHCGPIPGRFKRTK